MMASVIATESTRCFSMNSNISRAMAGSERTSLRSTFQSRNSSTPAFSDGTMPTVIFNAYYGIAGNFRAVQRFASLRFGP
jgi:hypothetical protein